MYTNIKGVERNFSGGGGSFERESYKNILVVLVSFLTFYV